MNADQLVSRVRDAGSVPVRADLPDTKVLDEINAEFFSRIVTRLRKTRGNYLLDFRDRPLVANQARYEIPARAIESSIDCVKYIDDQGNEVGALKEITLKQIGTIRPDGIPYMNTLTVPMTFYLDAASVVLSPAPSTAIGSLRIYFPRRPGKLVLDTLVAGQHSQVCRIASLAFAVNTTITIEGVHNGFPANQLLDIMGSESPFPLRTPSSVLAGAAVAGTAAIIIPAVDIATVYGVVAGDYVTLAKTAYIPEVPEEWHDMIVDFAIAKLFAKIGDLRSEAQWRGFADQKLKLLIDSSQPRVQDAQKKILPRLR